MIDLYSRKVVSWSMSRWEIIRILSFCFRYSEVVMEKRLTIREVQKNKIYKYLIEQIKRVILPVEIMKGNRLSTEEELAHQFGVSRVSVRQALIVLHEMGLVENRPGGETFVTNEAKERSLSSLTAALFSEIELLKGPLEVKRILDPEVTS
ncbi:MAG: winged helix-turn-helix domain-containing protein, partial [Deltaproteobacteria bacterium]|nr:winged helix-turn-helix domain-containing protein [Deltaproteobacteria bacterium]